MDDGDAENGEDDDDWGDDRDSTQVFKSQMTVQGLGTDATLYAAKIVTDAVTGGDVVQLTYAGSDDMEIHTKTYDPPLQKKDEYGSEELYPSPKKGDGLKEGGVSKPSPRKKKPLRLF